MSASVTSFVEQAPWVNAFNEIQTRELRTQWKHKISVIPESVGIASKWWNFTGGVSRVGPSAEVPAGEEITTTQSGDYNVGDPALAGAGVRTTGTPQSGASDDWWTGYTNRLSASVTTHDGVGIGYKYFNEGDGDAGGALSDGPQEYVWFDSSVTGVSDLVVPRDQWNGDDLSALDSLFDAGGFIRIPHTFYDEGAAELRWAVKTETGFDIKTLHTFGVTDNPMWGLSDLKWQMATSGTNLTGYIDAAHYKAGEIDNFSRQNSEGRDGSVLGSSLSLTPGEPAPIISFELRPEWESVNINPLSYSIDCDDSFYAFMATDTDVNEPVDQAPLDEVTGHTPADDEYAVLTDNDATDFNDIGDIGPLERTSGAGRGNDTSSLSGEVTELGLAEGQTATLGIIPIDATSFNSASLTWGADY